MSRKKHPNKLCQHDTCCYVTAFVVFFLLVLFLNFRIHLIYSHCTVLGIQLSSVIPFAFFYSDICCNTVCML